MSQIIGMPDCSSSPHYAAVIRAYQCTPLLIEVIEALRRQSVPPKRLIIVDSSRDPAVSSAFEELGADIVTYPSEDFNFSKAINLGVAVNDQPLTLIISSHMLIRAPDLIAKGWDAGLSGGMEIVYWRHPPAQDAPHECHTVMTNHNFNGRNGLSNTMAMIPTRLLRERPFREEVFSAEDQEWTKYYLASRRHAMLRIDTRDVSYSNPNHNAETWSETKLLREELAIGYFVNRRLLLPDRIIARLLRGILATLRRRPEKARVHFGFAWAMTKANFKQPSAKSRYF
ncbi:MULTISPECIES: glycosyltransferase family 2 protein [unclassified Mesorhizobium]|uniref:Glycosyltransferase family 2 protein n=1 Tax=Mesorhizobium salmacidum TaxID=3015171 RepID=A0ABU8KQD7_9HYPH|nr:glycosyltransferase family 2 protein [Mesorhizobium sp. WSM3626]